MIHLWALIGVSSEHEPCYNVPSYSARIRSSVLRGNLPSTYEEPNCVFDDSVIIQHRQNSAFTPRGRRAPPPEELDTCPPSRTSFCHAEAACGRPVPSYGVLDDEVLSSIAWHNV